MSNDINFGFNYDPVALSIINSFWEQPQYSVPENINDHSYYAPRFTPYNTHHNVSEPFYQPYSSYPYNYYGQPVYYQMPVQSAQLQQPCYTEIPLQQTSPSSESLYSVESHLESNTSLDTTIKIVDTPPAQVYTIEIPDNADSLPPVDEKVLQEVLDIIDITQTPPKPAETPEQPTPEPIKFSLELISEPAKPTSTPTTDDPNRKYQCIACDKFFLNRPGIRKHFRTKVHKKVVADKGIQDPVSEPQSWAIGDHKCFICGKTFAKYTDMIDHVVTH